MLAKRPWPPIQSSALDPLPHFEIVPRLIIDRRIFSVRDSLPLRLIECWKPRVTLWGERHPGQIQAIRLGQPQLIQLRAADQHHFTGALLMRPSLRTDNGRIKRRINLGTFELQIGLTTDHKVQPPRQRPPERVPGLAAHDDRLAEGSGFEIFEILWQMPGHAVVDADNAITRQRRDQAERERCFHGGEHSRATALEQPGWGMLWTDRTVLESRVTQPTPLEKAWLSEAVRLREEQAGPLEDLEANRLARHAGGTLAARIERRAAHLAERDGLAAALRRWQQGARLALVVLALLAMVSGAGLAFAALGDGLRPVNVFWALGSLLGVNLLLLLGWAMGMLFSGEHGAGLGRLWLWLSDKLARDAQAAHLGPALVVLLQRQRLNRWLLGAAIHGLWLVTLTSALAITLLLLATRRYGFVWETTLLSADTFIAATQALGRIPSALGFNVPDPALIRASGDGALGLEAARQAWATWLVGVLLVYGVLPRLGLWALCLWRWRRGRARLTVDASLPGYARLREALMPSSERLGVSDAAPADWPTAEPASHQPGDQGAVIVAIELDDQHTWPPTLPAMVQDAGILDSRESRQRLLEQLTRFPAARLVIACDPRRSPDRGSLALISELARCAAATRLCLLAAPQGQRLDADRLGDWHAALDSLQLPYGDSIPLTWLEHGDA